MSIILFISVLVTLYMVAGTIGNFALLAEISKLKKRVKLLEDESNTRNSLELWQKFRETQPK